MSGPAPQGGVLPEAARREAAAEPAPGRLRLGRDFWLVFLATFTLNTAANLFVLFPLLVVRLGGGASLIGAIIGTWSLFALLARPGAGMAIDRYGRKRTALAFMMMDAAAIALYLPIGSLGWNIFAVRAIHGAVEGTARVALFAMVFDLLPQGRRGEAMSIFSLCGMGSSAFAPIAGELIIRHFGFTVFFLSAISTVAAGALATSLIHEPAPMRHRENPVAAKPPTYRRLIVDSGLMPLWIVTFMFSLAISCRLSFVAPYAYAEGIRSVGEYFGIYSVVAIIVRLTGGRVLDRIGLERTMVPSFAVLAVGLALLAGTGRAGWLEMAALVGGLGHGYLYPALSALVITRTEANAMGRSSSIYTSLYDLGSMSGPYILGMVGEFFGYAPLFIAAGATALLAAVYFLASERRSMVARHG